MKIRAVTANVDFALRPAVAGADIRSLLDDADVLLLQEAKNVDVDAQIRAENWKVHQINRSDSTQGSVVAWDNRDGHRIVIGIELGVLPHGLRMLARYIAWVTLEFEDDRGESHYLCVVSAHFPPKRFWSIYPYMVYNVIRFVNTRKAPVLIGADFNQRDFMSGISRLARSINATKHLIGIDGFLLVSKNKWRTFALRRLPRTHSDHAPVQIVLISN